MTLQSFDFIPMLAIMATSLILLLSQSWRQMIISLALQYLFAFLLLAYVWPLGLAAVKLIVGWMSGAVLAASQPESEFHEALDIGPSSRLFRILAALMVWMLVFSVAPGLQSWIAADYNILVAGSVLVAMGLLQLGMTNRSLRVIVGLLTVLTGFEILYANVESSVLVAGLLALVNLGLALVGAYLLASNPQEEVS